ncbi:Phenylalanine--tRNA ligase subunit beta [Candidatus Hepatincolaceae symbiont of Richtersius coronifer]
MKFTLNWLADHLEFDCSLDELVAALIKLGIEVEDIQNPQANFVNFSIAYIKSTVPHFNADKLKVCTVATKEGDLQIVCGASNARAGIYVVFAPEKSYIPGLDITIKKTAIRGVESNGMLLSEKELGLSQEHEGIIEFTPEQLQLTALKGNHKNNLSKDNALNEDIYEDGDSTIIGQPIAKSLGLDDVVIEVSITPNRGDLLGVRGIAKDLAANGIGKLKDLKTIKATYSQRNSLTADYKNIDVSIETPEFQISIQDLVSKAFMIAKIINLNNPASPLWMQKRLSLIGQTPRNALVDITNYICFDLNQPMHCYDLDKLPNPSTIAVRLFDDNIDEKNFLALDNKPYSLNQLTPIVVIGNKIGAIAGIKGALSSACDENTKNIFLEAAHFDSKVISLAKRNLGINTESAYRFERKIDIDGIANALDLASDLIKQICGGNKIGTYKASSAMQDQAQPLVFDLAYFTQLSTLNLSPQEVSEILKSLNFQVKYDNSTFKVIAPSNRNDIDDKSVVVAEIIKYYGLDKLTDYPLFKNFSGTKPAYSKDYQNQLLAKRSLAKQGFLETINMSFIAKSLAYTFGLYEEDLVLANPISDELSIMRKSIVPSLTLVGSANINRGYPNFKIFEVGEVYIPTNKPLEEKQVQKNISLTDEHDIKQKCVASGILVGNQYEKNWQHNVAKYSVWEAKAAALTLIEDLGFNPDNLNLSQEDLPSYYHPGKSGKLFLKKGEEHMIAYFGELNPMIVNSLKIKNNICCFEVFIENIPGAKTKSLLKSVLEISPFMPVSRDFAFEIDKNVKAAAVIKLVKAIDKKHIAEVNIFDIYEGSKVSEGKKSIALNVILQSYNTTFVDKEIQDFYNKIVNTIEANLGATLRKAE